MKPILTYREYKALEESWKQSNSASRMLDRLPYDYLGRVRTGLRNAVESFFKEIGTDDELSQFHEDCEIRDVECELRIQDHEITQEEADTIIAHALQWTAMYELQSAEHLDAMLAAKLREFVDIRRILVFQSYDRTPNPIFRLVPACLWLMVVPFR